MTLFSRATPRRRSPCSPSCSPHHAAALPAIAAPPARVSELVVDAVSGRTLYAAAADRVRPPASLTKMMTLLLAFEAISAGRLRLDDQLVMTSRGARQPPSRLGLAAGRTMSVRAAIRTVAVVSANDVAVALAERVGGSEQGFVRAMNRRAAQLGMTRTRFTNATGLAPAGGTTTARDMARLARQLIRRFPERYRVFSARTIRWDGQVRPNHNRLLGRVHGGRRREDGLYGACRLQSRRLQPSARSPRDRGGARRPHRGRARPARRHLLESGSRRSR